MSEQHKIRGLHTHRYRDNPLEQRFAEAWERDCKLGRNLEYLLCPPGTDQHCLPPVSDRDCVVAATVVQWLGSPVGQAFIRDVMKRKSR